MVIVNVVLTTSTASKLRIVWERIKQGIFIRPIRINIFIVLPGKERVEFYRTMPLIILFKKYVCLSISLIKKDVLYFQKKIPWFTSLLTFQRRFYIMCVSWYNRNQEVNSYRVSHDFYFCFVLNLRAQTLNFIIS